MDDATGETAQRAAVGFAGLGVMGRPMALNLVRAGVPLVVWSRTADKTEPARQAGAAVASDIDDLFARTRIVVLMLANGEAVDEVLGRGGPAFARRVAGHTVVTMGTTSPAYSVALGREVVAAGGRFVEAPVSGSRAPAEAGRLVAMVAGDDADVAEVSRLIEPLCAQVVACGPVPNALGTKLAVNLYLITLVSGLAEAYHFAAETGLDLAAFRAVLDGGQMASDISRLKLGKLVAGDFTVQAAIADVHYNSRLVADRAREVGIASPLLDVSRDLFAEAEALGHGRDDMVGVLAAIQARCRSVSP
ncbi:NAD(P)-dependent oxidoreductase [Microlunatus ginsengisoli]|uniref:NAD(P)-dependent oxidoreductase n=1 Tax=Microlunatus ginsengisoli TaxID=363863 RepID=A0ABP7A6J4_9ACTN